MKQENKDYLLFLERKGKLGSAIESLGEAYEKLDLIEEVYTKFFKATESFEVDNIGPHLAYLFGAIARNDKMEFFPEGENDEAFWKILNEHFPAEHPVYGYIEIVS